MISLCTIVGGAILLAITTAYAAMHPPTDSHPPKEYFTQPPPPSWPTAPAPLAVPITGPVNYHPHLPNGMSVHPIPVKTILYREEPLPAVAVPPPPVPRPRPLPR